MYKYYDRNIMNLLLSENNMNSVPPIVYQILRDRKVNLKVLISNKLL